MTDAERWQEDITTLDQCIAGAGIDVAVEVELLRRLSALADWYGYNTKVGFGKVYVPQIKDWTYTEVLSLSSARELRERAVAKIADRVAQALS